MSGSMTPLEKLFALIFLNIDQALAYPERAELSWKMAEAWTRQAEYLMRNGL